MALERLTLSLPASYVAWLRLQADANGVSPAEIVRRLITAERGKPELSAFLAPPTKREKEVLKTLRDGKP